MIPIARPFVGEEESRATAEVLRSGWLTQGPQTAAFEKEFAACTGAAHACAVSSCTTALDLALRAVGVRAGDEVITASHSFIATANSIRYQGAIPVFIDIEAGGFNLDPALLEAAISPYTRAILAVHQVGMPCDLRAILEISRRHSLPVVEDAACAIGSEILWDGVWEKIGKPHADIACFSFHPRKVLTTGDGGMLTTSNAEWDRQFRLWRQHGMSVPDSVRHGSREVIFESYPVLGYNFRMTDVQAAIGREQLKRLPLFIEVRRQMAARYRDLLGDVRELGLPCEPAWARSNWQSYCVRLAKGIDQRRVMQNLLDRGISTRRGVMCSHRETAGDGDWRAASTLLLSEEAQDETIVLPLFHQLTGEEQDSVAAALIEAVRA